MSSIIQEWKSMGGKQANQFHHLISYATPVVSFMRFGASHNQISKSKILNDVISESEPPYNYFFHRDCPGGQYKRILGEGLVDMSWYIPSGKETDLFSDAITFLNLHGDARKHPKLTSFLSQISSMCFILITEKDLEFDILTMENLKKFHSTPGGITFLNAVAQKPMLLKKTFPQLNIIDLMKRNSASVIKKLVQQRIKSKVENLKDVKSIEQCVNGNSFVIIDNESDLYREGQIRAHQLMDIIGSHKDKHTSIKEAMLPLQGETLWCAWAYYDKELHRQIERGKETVNEYSSSMTEVKNLIRRDQLLYVDSLTPLTAQFIESLLNLGGMTNRILRNYFLQCLKLNLNTLSRETMSILLNQYQSVRKSLSLIQSDNLHPEKIEKKRELLKKKLEIVQEDTINSSFGLEHFFRELGQVYEAALRSRRYGNELSLLPKAVAELLIDGYPLELMDGDAAHVPLEWVKAVLKEAVKILGDPNVFVLSVLGLQSTGKSTMLNTTFGVQFNVSAGRCTRGAYMQLLPLHEEIRKETNCSYVLIVDTEGLRAPELDPNKTQKHDNELATFVIGLANTTLINIYGEVPGDMDDILQTVVHALLRMSQVRRHPSCQFVHQNAGVNTKSEIGRAKFTQKLNQFTKDAAKEERCEGQYKCFNDVIEFDDQTDVHYFPGLWKGDPPMAPVNQGYSRAAQQLKQHIIKIICNRASKTDLSLSSFCLTVSDFWNALLCEKFVFSFKNTLEITAYNSLETAYSKWQWKLRETMLNWELKAENIIKTEPSETLSNLVTQKLTTLQVFVENTFTPIKMEMADFFNGKQSEILIQWKAKFELRINSLLDQLKQHAEKRCNRLVSARKAISSFERDRKRAVEEIKGKVREHIANVKQEQEVLHESIKSGNLEPHQLDKLLCRDLFTSEKLALYKEQNLISSHQVARIQTILTKCGGKFTEDALKKILFAETLTTPQVESILKTPQSEKELKIEFEKIWLEWTSHLQVVSGQMVDVEKEVEYTLTEFVTVRGYDGQLIEKLNKTTLRKWGEKVDFTPDSRIHYTKPGWVSYLKHKGRKVLKIKEECPDCISKMTQDILHEANKYLEITTKTETDFQVAYVLELLNLVEKQIEEYSSSMKDSFTFTYDYNLDMYLIACGSAIPAFHSMAKIFQEKSDPIKYLESKEKGPLFIKFKNQYDQTEAEEAIASSLCAYLEEPIKIQIRNSLGPKMVTKMKSSGQQFDSKVALKVKVLHDLHKKEFEDYMLYVRNVRRYLQQSLQEYTIMYCNDKVTANTTRLQTTAKEEVNRLIKAVQNVVSETNESYIHDWLEKFCRNQNFRSELGEKLDADDILCGCDSSQQLDLDDFKLKITLRLKKLKQMLHSYYDKIDAENEIIYWKEKPHQLLQDLIGCTEQCPFCKEQCDLLDPSHIQNKQKHRVAVHRLHCVSGRYKVQTNTLSNGICPERVASEKHKFRTRNDESHLYSKYRDIYPDWAIPRDPSAQNCLYWKMFVAKYADSLSAYYEKKKPVVESDWVTIDWREVEENLREVYNL